MLSSSGALVSVVLNSREYVMVMYPIWQAKVSEQIRSCKLSAHISLTDQRFLFNAGTHAHCWPDAP